MTLVVNREFSVEQNVDRIERIFGKAISAFASDHELVSDLKSLEAYGIEMAHYAPEYDYKEIQANGFRSIIDMGIKLIAHSLDLIVEQNKRQHYADFKTILRSYVKTIPYLQRLRDESKKTRSLGVFGDTLTDMFVDFLASDEEERSLVFARIGVYEFGPTTETFLMWHFFFQSLKQSNNLKEWLACWFDAYKRRIVLSTGFKAASIGKLRKFLNQDNGAAFFQKNLYPYYVNGSACRVRKDFEVKRQEILVLETCIKDQSVNIVKRSQSHVSSSKTITCRLLHEPCNNQKPTTLLVNIHGGGYCLGGLYNNEVYLRYFAAKIPGTLAILSIGISLAPEQKCPAQIQETIDVLLFLIKAPHDELIITIGFVPERIFLSGDSSGACIGTAATIALAEMRKRWPEEIPMMPTSIFSFYGSFSVSNMMISSYFLTAVTPFLSPINFALFVEAYVPKLEDENHNMIDSGIKQSSQLNFLWQIADYIKDNFKWLFNMERKIKINNWFSDTTRVKHDVLLAEKLIANPFISPMNYADFECLSSISLNLFTCNSDPVLDHSIIMAHKWKGDVHLEVFDLMHGYLHTIGFDGAAKAAADRIVEQLRRVLNEQSE